LGHLGIPPIVLGNLYLDWRVLDGDDPLATRSKTKQAQLNIAINERAHIFNGEKLLRKVEAALAGVCECRIDNDPNVISSG